MLLMLLKITVLMDVAAKRSFAIEALLWKTSSSDYQHSKNKIIYTFCLNCILAKYLLIVILLKVTVQLVSLLLCNYLYGNQYVDQGRALNDCTLFKSLYLNEGNFLLFFCKASFIRIS